MKPVHVRYTAKDIGIGLLDSITKGIYKEPRFVLREYLQNAIDAEPMEIRIDVNGNSVLIRDDGEGMDRTDILKARRMGISEKPEEKLGFRGIGLWSGVAVSELIKITTSKERVGKKYILEIDTSGIKEQLYSRKPLGDILNKYVKIWEVSEDPAVHYTIVDVKNIEDEPMEVFRNEKELIAFIGQTIPVDFNPDFKFKETISTQLARNTDYYTVRAFLNNKLIHKPFINELESPFFHILEDEKGKRYGYSWACIHKERGAIKDPYVAGMIYKVKGMTIGDRRTTRELFVTEHLMEWVTGEIYVENPKLIPSTERSWFEYNPEREKFIATAKAKLGELEREVRRKSRKETAGKKALVLIKETEKISQEFPTLSAIEKRKVVARLGEIKLQLGKRKKEVIKPIKTKIGKSVKTIEQVQKQAPVFKPSLAKGIEEVHKSPKLNDQSKQLLEIILEALRFELGTGDIYDSTVNAIALKVKDRFKL